MQIAVIAICIFVLFRIQAIVYRIYWNRNLNISLQFQKQTIIEGEKVVLEERLENRKWLPLPVVFLQFKLSKHFKVIDEERDGTDDRYSRNEMLSVMMNQRFRRRLEMIGTKRGRFSVERASVVAKSLFLDEEYVQTIDCETKLTVYPRMVDASRFENLLQSLRGGDALRPFMQEDPFLIRGVREYQIYDNMRSINWNATAKTGSMKVNQVETVSSQQASIFLNVQKNSLKVHSNVVEEGIRLAKTFCAMFSKKGIKSSLYTNGTTGEDMEAICVKQGVGIPYMSRVNEALASIFVDENGNLVSHGREEELDFIELYGQLMEQSAGQGMVVVISNDQNSSLVKLLREMRRQGMQCLWIVPVENAGDYKEDTQLKDSMRIWKLSSSVL